MQGLVMTSIQIVIPVYNEALNIEETCTKIQKLIVKFGNQIFFTIFNDGSTDESGKILEKNLKINKDKIKIISLRKNMGLNYIERLMINNFKEKYILFLPADNRFSVETLISYISFILENTERYDIFQATPQGELRGKFRESISKIVAKLVELQLFKLKKFETLGLICLKSDLYNCYPKLKFRWGGTIFYRSIVACAYSRVRFIPIAQLSREPFNFKNLMRMIKRMPSAVMALLIFPWLTYIKVKKLPTFK
jgi:glycosyltransferase involved in cell wall biosynthesis